MATLQRTVGGRTPGERETEADDTNTATNTAPSTSSQDPLAPQANQSRDAEDYLRVLTAVCDYRCGQWLSMYDDNICLASLPRAPHESTSAVTPLVSSSAS